MRLLIGAKFKLVHYLTSSHAYMYSKQSAVKPDSFPVIPPWLSIFIYYLQPPQKADVSPLDFFLGHRLFFFLSVAKC